jgi:hypothetical protein
MTTNNWIKNQFIKASLKMNYDRSNKFGTDSTLRKQEKGGTQQRNVSSLDKLQHIADKSPQNTQMKALKDQMQKKSDPFQLKSEGASGSKALPAQLQSGVEQLSGLNMSDVKVNYGSPEPSKIGAAAYAQGSDIHLGPGQEQHLAHEAWHVVQQKKGKVSTTNTINGTPVNENNSLEKEADQMGSKAQGLGKNASSILQKVSLNVKDRGIIQKVEGDEAAVAEPQVEAAPNPVLIEKLFKYRGLVDMAKNAQDILGNGDLWSSNLNETDNIGKVETAGKLAGAATRAGAGGSESISGADKVAGTISASVGSSITALFGMIKSLRTLYQGFKGNDKMAVAMGSSEFVNSVKSGLQTANSIIKATSGVVNPAIAAAIPGLGIVVSAADIMINLSNSLNASQAEGEMSQVSESYKTQLIGLVGPKPEETADKLFVNESRGKFLHKKEYLRLKPGAMTRLEGIAASDQQETDFNTFKTEMGLPANIKFSEFYMSVRTYELGSKLQEINQKRKVHGGNQIFTSLISIAGDIAAFFPADGGITAASLKGTAAAISGGLAAGKFIQQQSRNSGWFGGDTNRSSDAKHQEYVQHAKSIYMILAQAGLKGKEEMSLETSQIDKIIPVESMIRAAGASPSAVYETDYGKPDSVTKQVKLIVDSMKKGRG